MLGSLELGRVSLIAFPLLYLELQRLISRSRNETGLRFFGNDCFSIASTLRSSRLWISLSYFRKSSPLSLRFVSFRSLNFEIFVFVSARLIDLLPNTTLYYSHLISSSPPLDFTRSIRFPRFLSPRNQLQTLRVHFKPFTNRSHGFVCEFENEVCEFRYGDDYEGISEKGFGEWDYCESSKSSLSLSLFRASNGAS